METIIKRKNSVVLDELDVQIATLLSQGLIPSTMKNKLRIKLSPRTIEGRIAKMRDEYSCKTAAHLVAIMLRLGIIK